jgi:hypothetical protein
MWEKQKDILSENKLKINNKTLITSEAVIYLIVAPFSITTNSI